MRHRNENHGGGSRCADWTAHRCVRGSPPRTGRRLAPIKAAMNVESSPRRSARSELAIAKLLGVDKMRRGHCASFDRLCYRFLKITRPPTTGLATRSTGLYLPVHHTPGRNCRRRRALGGRSAAGRSTWVLHLRQRTCWGCHRSPASRGWRIPAPSISPPP